ncbi:MAG TPA: hypothetical protein ENO25_03240, partial [Desulfobacteraceae bacterium]|nr:hypothetical protein [Desulfobacteraceae bacterium]
MMKMINRKDFLKLSSLIPAQLLWSKFKSSPLLRHQSPQKQNVLIIVFDTWSGENLSLFGYRRETSPELEKLARKAIVFHHHYAAAPWTMPGTASLLSGLYPWTHRVFDFDKIKYSQNIFGFFSAADYFIQTYTHNPLADELINVYAHEGQIRIPREQFFLAPDPYFHEALERDAETFYLARHQIFMNETEVTNSLFLPKIVRAYHRRYYQRVLAPYMERYPEEPPVIAGSSDYFVLDDPFNWMVDTLPLSPKPFLHYYHFYPPHGPYRPQKDFMYRFEDGWEPAEKDFPFPGPEPQRKINRRRREYDCYVSDVDAQFANLYRRLEQSGILEDTWLVLTSDHGELFERGVIGHSYITLHEPLLHVPLLIFPPGHQEGRIDIFDRTSA